MAKTQNEKWKFFSISFLMCLFTFWEDFSVLIHYINKTKNKNVIRAVGGDLYMVMSEEMAESPDVSVFKYSFTLHSALIFMLHLENIKLLSIFRWHKTLWKIRRLFSIISCASGNKHLLHRYNSFLGLKSKKQQCCHSVLIVYRDWTWYLLELKI